MRGGDWLELGAGTYGNPGVPMRRIDFLAGKNVFYGLVSKGYDGKVPRLSLRVGPRDSP